MTDEKTNEKDTATGKPNPQAVEAFIQSLVNFLVDEKLEQSKTNAE